MGKMYSQGIGCEVSVEKAKEWVEKSANHNNSDSQYELGSIYWKSKSQEWFEKSAEQGHEYAKQKLA